MISLIITAYKEPRTIGRAIEAIASGNVGKNEIIVAAPDKETLDAAMKLKKKYPQLRTIKDNGKGKPAALNLVVKKAKGDILVLSDGDVYVSKNAVEKMIRIMEDEKIGAVSGNPVSIDAKDNKLGFWAHVLSSVANDVRKGALKNGKRLFCSGYLFAIRKKLFPKLPEELLSEDGYISQNVYDKGFQIGYSEQSKVFIKYPSTFEDWIKQKKRSAGGYNQIKNLTGKTMRSFSWESSGALKLFKYVSGIRELVWLFELFVARVYLWSVIYRDINVKKKSQKEIWVRVESTK